MMMQYIRSILAWLFVDFDGPPNVMLGVSRSPQWDKVRDEYIARNPQCAVCGTKDNLEAHHIVPFHADKKKELDPCNLITLCRPHHILFGHLMNWRNWNEHVVSDAASWRDKIRGRKAR